MSNNDKIIEQFVERHINDTAAMENYYREVEKTKSNEAVTEKVHVPLKGEENPLAEMIEKGRLCSDTKRGILIIDGFSSIKPFQFADDTGIKYLAITESVKSIGAYAFINCTNLEAVALYSDTQMTESMLRTIFKGCTKLKEIWVNNFLFKIDNL